MAWSEQQCNVFRARAAGGMTSIYLKTLNNVIKQKGVDWPKEYCKGSPLEAKGRISKGRLEENRVSIVIQAIETGRFSHGVRKPLRTAEPQDIHTKNWRSYFGQGSMLSLLFPIAQSSKSFLIIRA
ncbi:MAG: hypothetical protein LBD58_10620 [Treponema sp.]|nr:hypothetical protein [Treponema sp.]